MTMEKRDYLKCLASKKALDLDGHGKGGEGVPRFDGKSVTLGHCPNHECALCAYTM